MEIWLQIQFRTHDGIDIHYHPSKYTNGHIFFLSLIPHNLKTIMRDSLKATFFCRIENARRLDPIGDFTRTDAITRILLMSIVPNDVRVEGSHDDRPEERRLIATRTLHKRDWGLRRDPHVALSRRRRPSSPLSSSHNPSLRNPQSRFARARARRHPQPAIEIEETRVDYATNPKIRSDFLNLA